MGAKQPQDIKLLLVDDEADFRNAMAFSFKRKGYQVFTASNGKEAFDLIKTNPIDAVISDIRMPGGDGIELLDRAKQNNISVPIVLLITGFADLTTEEAHNKGAEALFGKPIDRKSLEEAIVRLLLPPEERWTRIADRVDQELDVELHFQGLADAINAKVVNLGRGGMFVTLGKEKFPNVSDNVAFKVSFAGSSQAVSGSGVVRWVRTRVTPEFPAGCGIEFTYLGEAERQLVLNMVKERKPTAYIPNS